MNTVKKISTLFALALISQSSFAMTPPPPISNTTDNSGSGTTFSGMGFDMPDSMVYTPTTDSQITAGDNGNIRSAMQNISQGAYATNTANMSNNMNITDLNGSDLVNNMTMNTNAMNSNAGSSYNDSTNTINTTSTDSSTNTYASSLDNSSTLDNSTSAV